MRKQLTAAQRVIVAADFKPTSRYADAEMREQTRTLAHKLRGTGVVLKGNSSLRACGNELINIAHDNGLEFMADYKLIDIGDTLERDGHMLVECQPEILTVMCAAHDDALKKLVAAVPHTEVIGVTVLTSQKEDACKELYGCTIEEAVLRHARIAARARIGGVVASPAEATVLRDLFLAEGVVMTINTPNIRPAWAEVKGDDQNKNRAKTIAEALKLGADRLVIGRPITQAADMVDAVKRTIGEIEEALVS